LNSAHHLFKFNQKTAAFYRTGKQVSTAFMPSITYTQNLEASALQYGYEEFLKRIVEVRGGINPLRRSLRRVDPPLGYFSPWTIVK